MSLEIFSNLPPQLATFVIAMLPVTELRASIPFALGHFQMSALESFTYSVIGALVPSFFILNFIGPVSKWLIKNSKLADRFFKWLFERTRNKFKDKYATWGNLALMLFVAIPLPATGVWTGSLAAWLFGIRKKESLIYITLGAIISGLVVLLISLGIFRLV